VTILGELSL